VGAFSPTGEAALGGWYVLPIVFRDRFVGRIEPRIDRETTSVEVLNLWWEEGFGKRHEDGFVYPFCDALAAYVRFAGATRLEWSSSVPPTHRLAA
jgi:uncharacterized protein